jgi:hypothetical protein
MITTSKLCRVVSMHRLGEAVVLALELYDEITQRTAILSDQRCSLCTTWRARVGSAAR